MAGRHRKAANSVLSARLALAGMLAAGAAVASAAAAAADPPPAQPSPPVDPAAPAAPAAGPEAPPPAAAAPAVAAAPAAPPPVADPAAPPPPPDPAGPPPPAPGVAMLGPLGALPGGAGADLLLGQYATPSLPGGSPVSTPDASALQSSQFLNPQNYRVPSVDPKAPPESPYQLPVGTRGPFARVDALKGLHAMLHGSLGRMPAPQLSEPLPGTAPPPGTNIPLGPEQNLPAPPPPADPAAPVPPPAGPLLPPGAPAAPPPPPPG